MNAPWNITLFGSLRVQLEEHTITRFRTQKTSSLLAYLAYHLRQVHSRETLIELCWPESSLESGRASLSVSLSSLRHQLEPPGTPTHAVLRADRFSLSLNPAAVTTDVAEFEAALKAARRAQSSAEQEQEFAHAVELYQGPLLPGFYEDWITGEQERLSGLFFDAVDRLIALLEARGDLTAALSYARNAVRMDPLREEAHLSLMRLLAAAGQPGSALRQYKEFERLLEEELGEEPSATLRTLVRQIEKETGLSAPAPHPSVPVTSISRTAAQETTTSTTLTFLLTDVEGGARLQERVGNAFPQALTLSHTALHQEFARYGGQVVQEAGDSFQAAFASARQALVCAVASQQALASQPWPQETGPLPVRMALHTGDVEAHQGEYHGLTLQRAVRILLAAHGGQILCSQATAELVNRDLGESLRLADLGVFRLRDASTPERLFQVEYLDMPQRQFPAPSAEAGYQSSLPLTFTRFFGRERELALLKETLSSSETRLVTITGPGGNGKTRLALQAAEQLEQAFAGAIWFVALADTTDPQLIADTILDGLRLPRSPQSEPLDQIVEALDKQRSLLVLDNFEHLVEGGTQIVQTLLERVSTLTLLVTSRQLLGLSAEREFALLPLPTPHGGETPERLSLFESVQLFVDRAQAVKPDFQVTGHNAPAVAELCQRLEGIPLAIELAATRALTMTPLQMLSQLDQRFTFLISRKRDAEERHRTLHAAVDWSFQLLAPELQRFFARLSVFRGGWTEEAAAAVCEEPLALDYLAQLRECSLVLMEESSPEIRFRLMETLREYAEEQLTTEESAFLRAQHAQFYLALTEGADSQKYAANGLDWYRLVDIELSNLRAAFAWSQLEKERAGFGLRLAVALETYWHPRGRATEGRTQLASALASSASQHADLRAKALFAAADLARLQNDYTDARRLFEECRSLHEEAQDLPGLVDTLNGLGIVASDVGEIEAANSLYSEAVRLARQVGDRNREMRTLICQGVNAMEQGLLSEAKRLYEQALSFYRERNSKGGIAAVANNLANVHEAEEDYVTAQRLHEEALAFYREREHQPGIAMSLHNLGALALQTGDLSAATPLLEESLAIRQEIGEQRGVASCLRQLGKRSQLLGDFARTQTLLQEALLIIRETHDLLGEATLLIDMCAMAHEQNETDQAWELAQSSLRIQQALNTRLLLGETLENVAQIVFVRNAKETGTRQATRLLGAAEAAREQLGIRTANRAETFVAKLRADLRNTLGENLFSQEWETGSTMSWEAAIAYALEESG